jgi:hypothetical protein
MGKNSTWQDDYWLLLMQLYLQKPVGLKSQYSRPMVELSLELHIPPQVLFAKMCEIANLQTPRIERLWETYSRNPRRLGRAASLLRQMKGFGSADAFYDGVAVNESFELDWQPLKEDARLTPVMLILILDLYFHLTPITMVPETPEVVELARLIKLKAAEVSEILNVYKCCDPYLRQSAGKQRPDADGNSLLKPCQQVWQRFGNSDTEELTSYASQLKEYFRI